MANSIQNAEPSLASLLELFKGNVMMSINCHQVGEIVSFDASTQTAEVQIKMMKMQNGKLEEYPVLIDCPCVVLGGGQGRVTFPITAGDSCLVLFNDRDIDNWYAGGQKMLPRTERKHSYSDAIALVGIRNMQNKITDYLADGTELKYGNATIKLQDNKITINAPFININGNVNVVQNEVDDNSLHAYIIASYHSGTEWYRVWSDGWCEQGGQIPYSGTPYTASVVFLKEFADTNYTLVGGELSSQAINTYHNHASVGYNKTTSGFSSDIAESPKEWIAKGYIK